MSQKISLQFDWILSGGKLQDPVHLNGYPPNGNGISQVQVKLERLGKIFDAYLVDQAQKQDTTVAGEGVHIGHLKRILQSRTRLCRSILKPFVGTKNAAKVSSTTEGLLYRFSSYSNTGVKVNDGISISSGTVESTSEIYRIRLRK